MQRRDFVALCTLVAGLPAVAARPALADEDEAAAAIKTLTRGEAPREGRVRVQIPVLADNGNSVPVRITVDSSMTAAEHVKAIHLVSDRNPEAVMATFVLSPDNGRAQISSRLRLAGSQRITAIAEISDGSFWRGSAAVVVTLSACVDGS